MFVSETPARGDRGDWDCRLSSGGKKAMNIHRVINEIKYEKSRRRRLRQMYWLTVAKFRQWWSLNEHLNRQPFVQRWWMIMRKSVWLAEDAGEGKESERKWDGEKVQRRWHSWRWGVKIAVRQTTTTMMVMMMPVASGEEWKQSQVKGGREKKMVKKRHQDVCAWVYHALDTSLMRDLRRLFDDQWPLSL